MACCEASTRTLAPRMDEIQRAVKSDTRQSGKVLGSVLLALAVLGPCDVAQAKESPINEALADAVDSGNAQSVRSLLKNGANPEASRFGETMLECAVDSGNSAVISTLLNHRAKPSDSTVKIDGVTPFWNDKVIHDLAAKLAVSLLKGTIAPNHLAEKGTL